MKEKTIDVRVAPTETHEKFCSYALHQRIAISHKGQFAMDLIKLIGIVGPDDVLLTEEEVVDRAVKIAELAFAALEERGWTEEVPGLDDLTPSGQVMGFGGKAA